MTTPTKCALSARFELPVVTSCYRVKRFPLAVNEFNEFNEVNVILDVGLEAILKRLMSWMTSDDMVQRKCNDQHDFDSFSTDHATSKHSKTLRLSILSAFLKLRSQVRILPGILIVARLSLVVILVRSGRTRVRPFYIYQPALGRLDHRSATLSEQSEGSDQKPKGRSCDTVKEHRSVARRTALHERSRIPNSWPKVPAKNVFRFLNLAFPWTQSANQMVLTLGVALA